MCNTNTFNTYRNEIKEFRFVHYLMYVLQRVCARAPLLLPIHQSVRDSRTRAARRSIPRARETNLSKRMPYLSGIARVCARSRGILPPSPPPASSLTSSTHATRDIQKVSECKCIGGMFVIVRCASSYRHTFTHTQAARWSTRHWSAARGTHETSMLVHVLRSAK